jgi:hypothetical protein
MLSAEPVHINRFAEKAVLLHGYHSFKALYSLGYEGYEPSSEEKKGLRHSIAAHLISRADLDQLSLGIFKVVADSGLGILT